MFRIAALSVLLASACATAAYTKPLSALIDKHTVARGGRAAIEAVRAIEIDVRIFEPKFTVDGAYVATRDGQMRIDVYSNGQRVYTEALDGNRSWSMAGDAAEGSMGPPAATAALRHGTEFPFKLHGLHEMAARGHRLRQLEDETIDGVQYTVVQLTLNDGYQVQYYFKDCGLIERDRQRRALHVEIDPTPQWIETLYADYRPVAGVMYPFRQSERVVATGEVLSSSEVKAIRTNPPIDESRFVRPVASDASRRGSGRGVGRPADTWL